MSCYCLTHFLSEILAYAAVEFPIEILILTLRQKNVKIFSILNNSLSIQISVVCLFCFVFFFILFLFHFVHHATHFRVERLHFVLSCKYLYLAVLITGGHGG